MMNATNQSQSKNKSRRGRWALITGVTVVALAVSGAALAGHGKRGGRFPGMAIMRVMQDLDLTEQQEVQAIRIRRNLQEQAEQQRAEMKGSMAKVADELAKPNPDATKLHALADDTMKRIQKVVHSGIDQMLALHATFSPEQRAKLTERLRNIEERHGRDRDSERPSPQKK